MGSTTDSGARPAAEIVDPLPIEIPRPMVLLRLGYRRPAQVPEKTSRMIDEVMTQGRALLTPRAIYGLVEVVAPDPGVTEIAGAIRAKSGSLHERLDGCTRAVVFAATVGPAVESWGHELLESGEMTRGLLADAFASSAAITLGLEVEKIAGRRLAEEGLTATRRHAPGYGDWDLSDQTPLLSLLDAGRIGITLTEDHLMIPAKSISGIIGGR
jgi:cobalamin-dependent methionine synthase-like protein